MKISRRNRIRAATGFTLVEMLIVVVIVAVLAMIAIPSYQNQIRKSRRTDAKAALLDLAGREERYSSTHNAYTVDPASLGYVGAFPVSVGDGYYTVKVALDAATGFIATAQATAKGGQNKDTDCGDLILDGTGVQNATGTLGTASCWN